MIKVTDYDKMTLRDARELYMYLEKKEILESYRFPSKPGKDGYYRIYVSDPSKKTGRKQLFAKTITELQDKVYEHEKGITGRTKKTFREVYIFVLDEKLRYVKDPEKLLSAQNSVSVLKSYYKRYFEGTDFEERYIDAITKSDIEEIIYYNMKKYSLREKALNSLKSILKASFELAYEQYWIQENPFTRINFKKFNGMIVREAAIEKRVHSEDDMKGNLKEIHRMQEKKPGCVPAYALEMQILMGARRGEIPPLRKSDIHERYVLISREQITVKKHDDIPEHFEIVEHTKTYKNRQFPITESLKEFLERLFQMLDQYYPESEFLFPADNENGVINNNAVYHFYYRMCQRLSIPISRDLIKGTHSFRRNAITDVINASGGNLILAAELFGNSPEVAKKNYYTGVNTSLALEALNQRTFS